MKAVYNSDAYQKIQSQSGLNSYFATSKKRSNNGSNSQFDTPLLYGKKIKISLIYSTVLKSV